MKKEKVAVVLAILVFGWVALASGEDLGQNEIYRELSQAGRLITSQVVDVYGVPCVEARLKSGESVVSFCQLYPSLKKYFFDGHDKIALLNRMHHELIVRGKKYYKSTKRDNIFVPLDFSIEPRILPEYDPEIAHHPKFIKIYLSQQYEGCYEYGRLKYCFPVATGSADRSGITVTPAADFVITAKHEKKCSRLFNNAPMPFSLQLRNGHYFLHGGPVPGYPASKGCIRHFVSHAEILFGWAEIGTPGRTVGGKKGSFWRNKKSA